MESARYSEVLDQLDSTTKYEMVTGQNFNQLLHYDEKEPENHSTFVTSTDVYRKDESPGAFNNLWYFWKGKCLTEVKFNINSQGIFIR